LSLDEHRVDYLAPIVPDRSNNKTDLLAGQRWLQMALVPLVEALAPPALAPAMMVPTRQG
jgi:hypothetical protein